MRIASIARRITELDFLYFNAVCSLFLVVNKHGRLEKMSGSQTKKPLKSLNGFENLCGCFAAIDWDEITSFALLGVNNVPSGKFA